MSSEDRTDGDGTGAPEGSGAASSREASPAMASVDGVMEPAVARDLDSAGAHERPTPADHRGAFAAREASHSDVPGAALDDRVTSLAVETEGRPSGPSAALSGLWLGGTLAWVSSVLLMLDHVGALDRASGPILWVHALAFALYGCTQVGAGLREEGERGLPVRRGAVVLGTGLAAAVGFALLLGVLAPVRARGAYVLLGFYGIAVFFFAQRRARRALPPEAPGSRSAVHVVEALAVLVTSVVWMLDR